MTLRNTEAIVRQTCLAKQKRRDVHVKNSRFYSWSVPVAANLGYCGTPSTTPCLQVPGGKDLLTH